MSIFSLQAESQTDFLRGEMGCVKGCQRAITLDTFDIYDPRNPINKRRLEDDKPLQRQKHKRDRTHT